MSASHLEFESTPLSALATIARLVTKVTDRITGDRSEYPLLVASVTAHAIQKLGIGANVFYGPAAWVEVMEDLSVMWAGCWGEHTHFWVSTQFGEVVDLNTAVSMRKRAHSNPNHRPKFSPPLLWSREVPSFYRYRPEGLVELSLDSDRDKKWFDLCTQELEAKLPTLAELVTTPEDAIDFPEEAILCPGRRILDDAGQSFRHFDRAIMIHGIPEAPNF
jgi:hypothetical protein